MNVKYLALFAFAAFCGMGMAFATPSITSVTAQPRYPWNGKVDISYNVLGDIAQIAKEQGLYRPSG